MVLGGSVVASQDDHVEVQFTSGPNLWSVQIYFHAQFHALRHRILGDDLVFAKCLASSVPFSPHGGKSGASFWRTGDGQLIIKAVNSREFKGFVERGRAFFHYW